jgi:hypothetical protein
MEAEIFVNGLAEAMKTIKFMKRVTSTDGDSKKDTVHILYEPSGVEDVQCTMENLIGLSLWQAHYITGLESSLYAARAQLNVIKDSKTKKSKA